MSYLKMFVAIFAAGLSALMVGLTGDSHFSTVEIINVAIAVVGAIGVYYVPNAPNGPVAKSVVAALMAVLTLAVNLIAGGLTLTEWIQLAVAGFSAIGVYAVRNDATPTPAHI